MGGRDNPLETMVLFSLQYLRKPSKKSQSKGLVLEGFRVSFKIFKIRGMLYGVFTSSVFEF